MVANCCGGLRAIDWGSRVWYGLLLVDDSRLLRGAFPPRRSGLLTGFSMDLTSMIDWGSARMS